MRHTTRDEVDTYLEGRPFATFEDPFAPFRKGVIDRERGYESFRSLGRTWQIVLGRLKAEDEAQEAVAEMNEALVRRRA